LAVSPFRRFLLLPAPTFFIPRKLTESVTFLEQSNAGSRSPPRAFYVSRLTWNYKLFPPLTIPPSVVFFFLKHPKKIFFFQLFHLNKGFKVFPYFLLSRIITQKCACLYSLISKNSTNGNIILRTVRFGG